MAAFKMAGLQKALEESIPSSELDLANKKYHQLTEKYRDLLEKGNNLVLKAEMLTGLEVSYGQVDAMIQLDYITMDSP